MNLVQISGASTISSGHFVTSNKSDTILYNSEKGLEIQSISDKDIKRIDILSKSKKIMSFTRINETLYLNSLKTGSYSLIVELKNGEVIKRKLVKP